MDNEVLEQMYREELDEKLIAHLAKVKKLSLDKAMDIYYHSRMADMIGNGMYGIQYLDSKVLIEMMIDNEPKLFDVETKLNCKQENTAVAEGV